MCIYICIYLYKYTDKLLKVLYSKNAKSAKKARSFERNRAKRWRKGPSSGPCRVSPAEYLDLLAPSRVFLRNAITLQVPPEHLYQDKALLRGWPSEGPAF